MNKAESQSIRWLAAPDEAVSAVFSLICSVTRSGDLLDFGQIFKAFGNNNLSKSPTFLGNFCKGVKIYHISSEIIFRQLL